MSSTPIAAYTQPHQLEPLLPQLQLGGLVERTRLVIEKAFRLQHAVAPSTRKALQELVRGMNSYYSNRIEGQGTHPAAPAGCSVSCSKTPCCAAKLPRVR